MRQSKQLFCVAIVLCLQVFAADAPRPELRVLPEISATAGVVYDSNTTTKAQCATDSASAATAMATGIKTENGRLNWKPYVQDNGAVRTIAEWMRYARQASMGVITTVPFSHATPAGFVSHNISRENYARRGWTREEIMRRILTNETHYTISEEIIWDVRPEVVIGSGHPSASDKYIGALEYSDLKGGCGYVLAEKGEDGTPASVALDRAVNDVVQGVGRDFRLFGLFGSTKTNYFLPPVPLHQPGKPEFKAVDTVDSPTLAQATRAAFKVLSQNPNGFFLMVEGGDIDWANHANNYSWMLGAMHQFHEAVREAERFVDEGASSMTWNNTLFLVTADHANSYMRLHKALGQGELPPLDASGQLKGAESVVTYGLSGDSHTNELVMLYARGHGAQRVNEYVGTQPKSWYRDAQARIIDNTQICEIMQRAVREDRTLNVILFIGDGMQKAHEIAYSRYMYGKDAGLTWMQPQTWPVTANVATWDVTTYNRFALAAGKPTFDARAFAADPIACATLAYDISRGGRQTYPDDDPATSKDYYLTKRPVPIASAFSADPSTLKFRAIIAEPEFNKLFKTDPVFRGDGSLTFESVANLEEPVTVGLWVIATDKNGASGGKTIKIKLLPKGPAEPSGSSQKALSN